MSLHTPGPWTLTHISGSNFAVQRFEVRGTFGEKPNVYPVFHKSVDALDGATVCMSPEDARLIAAAPELLEVVEIIADYDTLDWKEFEDKWRHRIPGIEDSDTGDKIAAMARAALAKARGVTPQSGAGR